MSNAAAQGHDFAAQYVARYGSPTDPIACAELAASLSGLPAREQETFIDRAIGHFVNVATTGRGL